MRKRAWNWPGNCKQAPGAGMHRACARHAQRKHTRNAMRAGVATSTWERATCLVSTLKMKLLLRHSILKTTHCETIGT